VRGTAFLAWAWLRAHPGRTLLILLCVAAILLVPLALDGMVTGYARDLGARARSTPLVVGAPGSRFDLALAALHFRGRLPRPTTQEELERLEADPALDAIPLHVGHTARGRPVVGTTPDYHRLRGLEAASGTLPLRLGEATLGADAAAELGLAVGDRLLTDIAGLIEFGLKQPLKLRIVGVLARTRTPDDGAVFVDRKTSWILDGIGHLHAGAETADPRQILRTDPETGHVLDASIPEATEITPENAASFHVHEEPSKLPVTAILVLPADEKAATIVKGRYRVATSAQILDPTEVVDELLGQVFRAKAFFDANALLVGGATLLLLGLVVLLTLRLRRGELETLARIGASRARVAGMLALEWLLVLGAGAGLAILAARLLLPPLLRHLLP
jgi:putative ABC transport system permease protein